MEFEITPHKSVGGIRFGMTRVEIRSLFGEPRENSNEVSAISESDEWPNFGLRVDYTEADTCEAILLTAPLAQPILNGRRLLDSPHRDICSWLRELDPGASFPADGEESLWCNKLGIMLGAPRNDEPEETRVGMALLVWAEGYWDEVEMGVS